MPAGPAGASIPTPASADSGRPEKNEPVSRGLLKRFGASALERATVNRLLRVGLPIVGLFMLLTFMDAGGQVVLWENAHWTAASFLAAAVAISAAYRATGFEQRLRTLVGIGTAAWFIGQLSWDVQTAGRLFQYSGAVRRGLPAPRPSGQCRAGALHPSPRATSGRAGRLSGRHGDLPRDQHGDPGRLRRAARRGRYARRGDLTVAYPILHLATAGAGLVAVLAARTAFRAAGAICSSPGSRCWDLPGSSGCARPLVRFPPPEAR